MRYRQSAAHNETRSGIRFDPVEPDVVERWKNSFVLLSSPSFLVAPDELLEGRPDGTDEIFPEETELAIQQGRGGVFENRVRGHRKIRRPVGLDLGDCRRDRYRSVVHEVVVVPATGYLSKRSRP